MTTPPPKPLRVLLLEDNPDDVDLAKLTLRKLDREFTLQHVETRSDFEQQLVDFSPDIILADHSLPGYNGHAALEHVQAEVPHIPFIFVSGTMGEEVAIEALKQGAVDYVLKARLQRLVPAVERALREAEARTATRQTRAELRRTQRLLRAVIDHSPALISVRDPALHLLLSNHPFNDRFGLPSAPPEAIALDAMLPPAIAADVRAHDEAVRQQKMPVVREHTWRFAEGTRTYLSVGFLMDGSIDGTAAVCSIDMDISDRKHTEAQLQAQANVLDQASDAIYRTAADQRLVYCNRAAEAISGWSAAEIVGKTISEIFPDISSSQIEAVREQTRQHGNWRGEIRVRNKRQELLWIEMGATLMRDAKGRPDGHVLICTDITEKKQLAEQFLRVQRLENLGMLSAGIAHDLNNVLSPIGMVATLLESRLTEERDRHFLKILEQSTNRGAGLVRQILSFAHGVSGELREVQVKHILRDVLAMAHETFPKNIAVEEHVPSDLWVVKGDPTQIHQIVLNLCVNARDAMGQGGTLTVAGENVTLDVAASERMAQATPGDWLKITVGDTGEGIPADILEKIWSPFFSTKAAGKGTGLGLSTVRGIVERHGGFVEVDTTPGEGTAFHVYIPAMVNRMGSASPFDAEGPPRGAGEHILVVDDEVMILDMAKEALVEHGYRVSTAEDGKQAAEVIMADPNGIDLLLTDLMMPKISGVQLISMLKSLHAATQVIVMTGMDLKEVKADPQLQPLVAHYISKPFEIFTLLHAVTAVIGPVSNPPP